MLGSGALGHTGLGAIPGPGPAAANNPPFGGRGRGAIAATIVALWQPPDPQPHIGGRQPLAPRKLAPSISAVPENNPPFTGRGGSLAGRALSAAIAQPDPWTWTYAGGRQPYAPRRLSPGVPGQSVDLPPTPFSSRASKPAQITAVVVAQPDPWTYTFAGASQPYAPRRLSPAIPGQSIDNPPFFTKRKIAELGEIVTTWEPPAPQPWVPRYQVKFTASFTMIISIG